MDHHKDCDRYESNVRGYGRAFPAAFDRAASPHLWDGNSRRYVDLLCGAGALNHGHNPPEMVRRVVEHIAAGGPVQSPGLHTTAEVEFQRRFADTVLAPRGMADYVVQVPGPAGTQAAEAALELARKVTGRTGVIAFRGGFHDESLGALAATTSPLLHGAAGIPLRDVTIPRPRSGTRRRRRHPPWSCWRPCRSKARAGRG